jgi:hypothetical protein
LLDEDDELELDAEDQARVEDVLLVEALMGWDGDPCLCPECGCPRFRDDADDLRCADCRADRHWPPGADAGLR